MVTKKTPLLVLVDDDPNDEELARVALEGIEVPHRLLVKRDGVEMLDWISNLENEDISLWPKLILLDLKIPKVGGLEILEKLKSGARTRAIPVAVFTSSTESRDLESSYNLGANAYVRKPVDFGEYRETIQDMGRFWLERNRSPWSLAE